MFVVFLGILLCCLCFLELLSCAMCEERVMEYDFMRCFFVFRRVVFDLNTSLQLKALSLS